MEIPFCDIAPSNNNPFSFLILKRTNGCFTDVSISAETSEIFKRGVFKFIGTFLRSAVFRNEVTMLGVVDVVSVYARA